MKDGRLTHDDTCTNGCTSPTAKSAKSARFKRIAKNSPRKSRSKWQTRSMGHSHPRLLIYKLFAVASRSPDPNSNLGAFTPQIITQTRKLASNHISPMYLPPSENQPIRNQPNQPKPLAALPNVVLLTSCPVPDRSLRKPFAFFGPPRRARARPDPAFLLLLADLRHLLGFAFQESGENNNNTKAIPYQGIHPVTRIKMA